MKQGSLSLPERTVFAGRVEQTIHAMETALTKDALKQQASTLTPVLAKLRRDFGRISANKRKAKVLEALSPQSRRAYEQVFALLYECSPDKTGTKLLVDQMLARLARHLKKKS
jgi:molecular chaperone HtpG